MFGHQPLQCNNADMEARSGIAFVVTSALTAVALTACGSEDRAGVGSSAATLSTEATTASSPTISDTSMTSPITPSTAVTTTTGGPVFDFSTAGSDDGWRVTNDTVMGGVSSGELTWADGVLVFTGELSLANGGGFASIRSPEIAPQRSLDWASRTGLRVQLDGDGRTWTVELRTDNDQGGWISTVPTSSGGPTDVELPWTSFVPVTRFLEPRATNEPLDPASVVSLALYLVDGVEGPFRIGVRSIT